MTIDRTKNAKRNIFFGILNKLIVPLYSFFIRTVLIKKVGADYLGLNSLFSSILQVLNVAEFGFANAIVCCMYKPIAEDDYDTLCALLAYFRKVYFFIGIFVLCLGVSILPFLGFLINGEVPAGINIYFLFLIYLCNAVFGYLLFSYRVSLLHAYQRNDVENVINTFVFLFIYSLQLFILIVTKNYYLYVCMLPLSTFLVNLFAFIMTKILFPNVNCTGIISEEKRKELKVLIKGLIISKLTGVSRNTFDSIFLSMFLGLVATAIYNNYFYVISVVTGIILIIHSSITGGIGNSVVLETEEKNYSDLLRMNFCYMWISSWCTICLFCLFQDFMIIFFGKDLVYPLTVVFCFCLYFYILRMGDILSIYSDVNGLWWKSRYVAIVECVLNIVLNFVLGKAFGALGIVLGTLISILITTNTFGASIVFKNYFKHSSILKYFSYHLLYFIVMFFAGGITYMICSLIKQELLVGFIIKMIICLVIPNLIMYICYFKTKIYHSSSNWIKMKFLKS